MNKLRNLGIWLWHNKERLIFMALFVLLCYRVYLVFYPPQAKEAQDLPPFPSSEPPADRVPPDPPPRPPRDIDISYRTLSERNPFWYYAARTTRESEDVTPRDLGLSLLDVKVLGDRVRARISTRSTTKWYDEGDQFEQFELLSVDAESKTATVYSQQFRARVTLTLQGS